jgi:hypothetical protein
MGFKEFAEFAATLGGLLTALATLVGGVTGLVKVWGARNPNTGLPVGRSAKNSKSGRRSPGRIRLLLIVALCAAGTFGGLGLLTARMFPTVFGVSMPTLRLTTIPTASAAGDPRILERIEGVVEGVRAPESYRIVIYAKTDRWYVQPDEREPLTHINPEGTFSNEVRLGLKYAVLLVKPAFNPPIMAEAIPAGSADIIVSKTYDGTKP